MFLFRPQSLQSQDRLHGDVNLTQPLSWRLMTFAAVLLIASLVVFGSVYKISEVKKYSGYVDVKKDHDGSAYSRNDSNDSAYRIKIDIPSDHVNDYLGKPQRFVFEKGNSVEANLVMISEDFHTKDGINMVYAYSDFIRPVGYRVAPGMSVSFEAEVDKKSIISMIFS